MSRSAALLQRGDVVAGFEVESVIGVGGMATVYHAQQVSLGRSVALKVLAPQFTGDEVFRERFRREGMHAASLEHPNIVPVYDSGEQDGLLYLAMRLVNGPSLAEMLTTKGLTAEETIALLGPIASALDCAHEAGLIHRDVKPQNILITKQGHPYLADFGVAKGSNASGLTATGGFVGSVNYASPEQIEGLKLTAASDIYALTAVLYHCLAGDVPYPGESEASVMHSHLHKPPPTLPALEGAGDDLQEIFERGMAKDPGARYEHAVALLSEASHCVGRLPEARRTSVPAFPQPRNERDAPPTETLATPGALASATAVDRQREPPPKAPPEPKRKLLSKRPRMPSLAGPLRRVRGWRLPRVPRAAYKWLGAAAAAVAVAVVAILALGGEESAAESVRKGPVELTYREPWRLARQEAKATPYGLRFRAPVALHDRGSRLVAGMLANGAAVPGGRPPQLAAQLDRRPSRKPAHLGSAAAVRYSSTADRGKRAVTVFVVPTERGDIAVLCAEAAAGDASCAKTAETLRVLDTHPVAPGANEALAAKLGTTLRPVAKARSGGHASRLVAVQPKSRARGSRAIAAADSRGAKELAGLAAEPRNRAAVRALRVALRREARALRAAAAAADENRYAKYAGAAKSARAAGREVARAAAALRRMAFKTVPALHALRLPPLPRPEPEPSETTVPSTSVASAPATSPESAPAPAPEPEPSPPAESRSPQPVISAPK